MKKGRLELVKMFDTNQWEYKDHVLDAIHRTDFMTEKAGSI